MATGISARLTPRELRRFGLTVAGPFLLLAGLAAWRGRVGTASVFASLALVLAGFALVAPAALGPFQRFWMGLAQVLGKFNNRVLLTVVWLLTIVPTGAVMRWIGRDSLARQRADHPSYWITRRRQTDPKRAMERWF